MDHPSGAVTEGCESFTDLAVAPTILRRVSGGVEYPLQVGAERALDLADDLAPRGRSAAALVGERQQTLYDVGAHGRVELTPRRVEAGRAASMRSTRSTTSWSMPSNGGGTHIGAPAEAKSGLKPACLT